MFFGQNLQSWCQGRCNDRYDGPFIEETPDLAFGDAAAAEDQTGLAGEIEINRIHKRNSLSKLYAFYYTIIKGKSCSKYNKFLSEKEAVFV